jgi:hypothetical protein
MRIRAHVAKAINTTIASSIDSLRWCGESMRAGREIVIIQFRAKSFSAAGENVRKQTAVHLVVNKTGTADMQLIFELIWNQSRSRFLATTREHRQCQ